MRSNWYVDDEMKSVNESVELVGETRKLLEQWIQSESLLQTLCKDSVIHACWDKWRYD